MPSPPPESNRSTLTLVGVLAGSAAILGLVVLPRLAPEGGALLGKLAPDVAFPVAANGDPGARMQLADLRGQLVIVEFWATWCPGCGAQAPILERVARRHEKDGLVVLGVSVDDPPELARAYAAEKGLSYPILVDPMRDASRVFSVDVLPSLVLIDKEGRVVKFLTGVVDEAKLEEMITAL